MPPAMSFAAGYERGPQTLKAMAEPVSTRKATGIWTMNQRWCCARSTSSMRRLLAATAGETRLNIRGSS